MQRLSMSMYSGVTTAQRNTRRPCCSNASWNRQIPLNALEELAEKFLSGTSWLISTRFHEEKSECTRFKNSPICQRHGHFADTHGFGPFGFPKASDEPDQTLALLVKKTTLPRNQFSSGFPRCSQENHSALWEVEALVFRRAGGATTRDG